MVIQIKTTCYIKMTSYCMEANLMDQFILHLRMERSLANYKKTPTRIIY